MDDLLLHKKIVVLLGAGGVGKTTTSIALALRHAMLGKNVALLSIDPAKRLASALGIPLGLDLKEIDLSHIAQDETEVFDTKSRWTENQGPWDKQPIGRLFAGMLDQKAVFDQMVYRHAPSPEVANKILRHPIYQSASTSLSGPIEYMALAKLKDLAENPLYDMIVVDTPPDTHALDFLERPNVLAGFMDQGVLSWLIKPFLLASRFGLSRFLNTSEKLMGGLARVTGFGALTTFAEFLVLSQDIIEGFHKTGERIVSLLHESSTGFVLVMVPTFPAMRSALHVYQELEQLGYDIDLVIFNRTLDRGLVEALKVLRQEKVSRSLLNEDPANPKWHPWELKAHQESQVIERTLDQLQKNKASNPATKETPWIRVKDQKQNLGDLASTLKLASCLHEELKALQHN